LGTVDNFIKVKELEQRADNSAPISASVMNAWGHAPTAACACLSTVTFLPFFFFFFFFRTHQLMPRCTSPLGLLLSPKHSVQHRFSNPVPLIKRQRSLTEAVLMYLLVQQLASQRHCSADEPMPHSIR
jgi:hypothetical protein